MFSFIMGNFDAVGGGGTIGGVTYKGSVSTKSALDEIKGSKDGDLWLVEDVSQKYIYSSSKWQLYSDSGLSVSQIRDIVNPLLNKKVDVVEGSSLMTKAEHEKLANAITEHQSLEDYVKKEILAGYVKAEDGKGLSSLDFTQELKDKYEAAYIHSTKTHAPADAEKNVIVSVSQNGVKLPVDKNRNVNMVITYSIPTIVMDCPSTMRVSTESEIKATPVMGSNNLKSLEFFVDDVSQESKTDITSGTEYSFKYTPTEVATVKVKITVTDVNGLTSSAVQTVTIKENSMYAWEVGYNKYTKIVGNQEFEEYVTLGTGKSTDGTASYTIGGSGTDYYGKVVIKSEKKLTAITQTGIGDFTMGKDFAETVDGDMYVYSYVGGLQNIDGASISWR